MSFHPHIPHPRELLADQRIGQDWLMDRLARLFGSPWTVWMFMAIPLVAEYWAYSIQNIVFFLSSAWVQLFALPLLTYISNKAEAMRSAKADADHAALVHIATVVDGLAANQGKGSAK